ncbi:MAG: M48 family metallopeptidase [Betaproteobacteria bacterium]|nr:MAG: M48 family metallopeptidase [Betaproteobacteria bacterium]
MKKFLALIIVAVTVTGCQTNPVTGRSQVMIFSEETAIAQSKEAYSRMLKPLADKGKVNNDAEVLARVETITSRIVAQAVKYRPESENWNWSIRVIDDPETVNAWCMAGGRMAIYTGLIEKLDATDDEIAQVMGHEISHALLGHTVERMSRAVLIQAGIIAVAVTQESDTVVQGAALAAVVALQLPNSRTAEAEADVVGIELAAKAGYDPRAAETLWKKMAEESGAGESRFDFLSTHPAPVKRMETLRELAPKMMVYYEDAAPRPTYAINTSPPAP